MDTHEDIFHNTNVTHVCLGPSLLPFACRSDLTLKIVRLVQLSYAGEQVPLVSQDVVIKLNFTLTDVDLFHSKFATGLITVVFVFSNRPSISAIIEVGFDQDLLSFCFNECCHMDTLIFGPFNVPLFSLYRSPGFSS